MLSSASARKMDPFLNINIVTILYTVAAYLTGADLLWSLHKMYLQRFQNRPTSRQLFVWRWLNLFHSQRCITPKLIERWNKHTHTTMGNKFHIRGSKIISWACSNIHATPCKNEICWLKHPHTHTHIYVQSHFISGINACMHATHCHF